MRQSSPNRGHGRRSVPEPKFVRLVVRAELSCSDVGLPRVVLLRRHGDGRIVLTGAVAPARGIIVIGLVALTVVVRPVRVALARARRIYAGGQPMARITLHDRSLCSRDREIERSAELKAAECRRSLGLRLMTQPPPLGMPVCSKMQFGLAKYPGDGDYYQAAER